MRVLPLLGILISFISNAQEYTKTPSITLFTGMINYQGDLNPNSFTFQQSNFTAGLMIRQPLSRWFALRGGISIGKIQAADRYNRDYLKPRNLSFFNTIKEVNAALEINLQNPDTKKLIPFVYGGVAGFHMNPWTLDNEGKKTYLQPLSTEGQGLYPEQKEYGLYQLALSFGGGVKYKLSDGVFIGIDFSQRKSFTDYIDDVSTHFVDRDVLLQAKGPKAVELAYRGDEVGAGMNFPAHGAQRGTPSEMDWYYYFGATIEVRLDAFSELFGGGNNSLHGNFRSKCPRY